uniref:SCP domain-containing protein n=1 Tax=viral metagenome TaxID=1070528 RepID=A0A6C0KWJ8_9ZZZZ
MAYLGRSIYGPYFGPRYFGGYGPYGPCDYDLLATEGKPPIPKVPLSTDKEEPVKKSAIVLKAASSIAQTAAVFNQDQINEITAYINNYRTLHQAPPLTWDPTIAIFSQNWANYLLNNNLFQHSGTSLYGENLAYFQGYGTDFMGLVKLAVDMWYNEIKLYDFTKPGFSEATGHFTALVWKSSTTFAMGFAINTTTNAVDVTMNTSPPGNVIGQFDTNVLAPTSSTPAPVPVTTPTPTVVPSMPQNIPTSTVPPPTEPSTPSPSTTPASSTTPSSSTPSTPSTPVQIPPTPILHQHYHHKHPHYAHFHHYMNNALAEASHAAAQAAHAAAHAAHAAAVHASATQPME